MARELTLRPASLDDADLLLDWRNDAATRAASHGMGAVDPEEHRRWLEDALAREDRTVYVAVEADTPVGTVRADTQGGAVELSWTVAPGARGRGVGTRMVAALAERIDAPLRAEIKAGNQASIRIAEAAGLRFEREEDGVLHYARAARR